MENKDDLKANKHKGVEIKDKKGTFEAKGLESNPLLFWSAHMEQLCSKIVFGWLIAMPNDATQNEYSVEFQ